MLVFTPHPGCRTLLRERQCEQASYIAASLMYPLILQIGNGMNCPSRVPILCSRQTLPLPEKCTLEKLVCGTFRHLSCDSALNAASSAAA